jgi:membrane protease YdiL (CAAX protease family)
VYYGSADFYKANISSGESIQAQYYYFLSSFLLLGLIPLCFWLWGFRNSLSQLGLSLGNIKGGLLITAAGFPVIIIIAFLAAKNPAFRTEYPLYRELLLDQHKALWYWLILGLYYIGWELFFRGFMLIGLENKFGQANSVLIQTLASCLVHIGKPDAEIFGSIIAGLIFGWIVLKYRSIWPVFILHWSLGVFLDIFIVYG